MRCLCCNIKFPDNTPMLYGLCSKCSQFVLDYFNNNIVHDEKVWQVYECHLDHLDGEIEHKDLIRTYSCNESEYINDNHSNREWAGLTKNMIITYCIRKVKDELFPCKHETTIFEFDIDGSTIEENKINIQGSMVCVDCRKEIKTGCLLYSENLSPDFEDV